MYFEAIKWALGLTEGDATPRAARPPARSQRQHEDRRPSRRRLALLSLTRPRGPIPGPEDLSQARPGLGRRPQRLPARVDHPRAEHHRAAGLGVGPLRHDHPHRLAVDHQVADPVQDRHRHRHRRAVPGPQPELLRRDLLLRRPRDRSRRRSSAPTCCRSSATTARASWRRMPARRRSSRGRSSARCSAAASTSIPGASAKRRWWSRIATSPITRHLPPVVRRQRRALPAEGLLARASSTCSRGSTRRSSILKAPLVHRTDRRLPGGVDQDLRQGPRVLLDARPSARAVGQGVDADRCTSKR